MWNSSTRKILFGLLHPSSGTQLQLGSTNGRDHREAPDEGIWNKFKIDARTRWRSKYFEHNHVHSLIKMSPIKGDLSDYAEKFIAGLALLEFSYPEFVKVQWMILTWTENANKS